MHPLSRAARRAGVLVAAGTLAVSSAVLAAPAANAALVPPPLTDSYVVSPGNTASQPVTRGWWTSTSGAGLGEFGTLGGQDAYVMTTANAADKVRLQTSQLAGLPISAIASIGYETYVNATWAANNDIAPVLALKACLYGFDSASGAPDCAMEGSTSGAASLYWEPRLANLDGQMYQNVTEGEWQPWAVAADWWSLDIQGSTSCDGVATKTCGLTLDALQTSYPKAVVYSIGVGAGTDWGAFTGGVRSLSVTLTDGTHIPPFMFRTIDRAQSQSDFVISPSNIGDAPALRGWWQSNKASGTGAVAILGGHDAYVMSTTGASDKARLQTTAFSGLPISIIAGIGYTTYVESSWAVNQDIAPALFLQVCLDGLTTTGSVTSCAGTDGAASFVWEPRIGFPDQPVVARSAQGWPAVSGWWTADTVTGTTTCDGLRKCISLEALATAYPKAVIAGLGFGVGTDWGAFTGSVSNLGVFFTDADTNPENNPHETFGFYDPAAHQSSSGETGSGATTPEVPAQGTVVTSSVPAGGSASSSTASKPSSSTPVIASVVSPVAGKVSFTPGAGAPSQSGYAMAGQTFRIEAPTASAAKPLALSFDLDDASLPLGTDPATVTVFRDGVAIAECAVPNAAVADPDPCVASQRSAAGVTTIKVLSSHASLWTFGTKAATAGSNRIGGADRYETSALIATQFGTANAVIVANGSTAKNGADALSANYLAGRKSAPILLTEAAGISPTVLTAVKKVFAGTSNPTVYIVGGLDSVSDAAAAQLKSAAASVASGTVTISRIAGADRYETSTLTVAAAGTSSSEVSLSSSAPAATTAILASGEVNADALSAGPVSNAWGLPLLLTGSDVLPTTVSKSIATHKIKQLIVLGGTDRVSARVLDQAKAAGVTTIKRIAGGSRFDTAARLYTLVSDTALDASGLHYGAGSGSTAAYLANGLTGFPDALSVGPLAGRNRDVLLTVGHGALPSPSAAFLNAHRASLETVTALGRGATVSDSALTAAANTIG